MSVAILRYSAEPAAATLPVHAPLQRGDGAAEIAFARDGGATVLAHLFQRAPCRVLFPRVEAEEPPLAVLLTTSGGLTGGDVLRLAVTARAGAAASVTSQAAEKIYRSLGPAVKISAEIAVEDGAYLEWLPQETILFDAARLERRIGISLCPSARLLAAEMVVFGRFARGERLRQGLLHDAWRVRSGERLVWADTLRLDGDIAARLDAPFAFAGAAALATALYVGADAARHLALARSLAEAGTARGGASLVNGILVARFLAARAELVRADLERFLAGMRHAVAGLPARLPRPWSV